jgi:hypothetical protein
MSTLLEITDVMRELLLRGQFSDMEIIRQDVTSNLMGYCLHSIKLFQQRIL